MKTFSLFCLLALPTLAADTTIVGKVVGVHDGEGVEYDHIQRLWMINRLGQRNGGRKNGDVRYLGLTCPVVYKAVL